MAPERRERTVEVSNVGRHADAKAAKARFPEISTGPRTDVVARTL